MRKKCYYLLTFIALTILPSHSLWAQSDTALIRQTITRLFDGMRESDTAKIRSTFAPSAHLETIRVGKDGATSIRTELIDSFLVSIARPRDVVLDERIVFDAVLSDGLLGSAWTPYKFYVGTQFSHCGVNSFQLMKLGGEWKIQYLIDTRRRQGCDSMKGF